MDEDEQLIFALLAGVVVWDQNGLPRRQFLTGSDERKALDALVEKLNSDEPLPWWIREELAEHLVPDARAARTERRLVFKRRIVGAPKDDLARQTITSSVWMLVREGLTISEAIRRTSERYDRDESTVKKYWLHFQRRWNAFFVGRRKKGE